MKRNTLLALLCAALLGLTACGGSGSTYYENEQWLSLLQNDEKTAELVLDGVYYALPTALADFTADGWQVQMTEDYPDVSADEVTLAQGERIEVYLVKGENTVQAYLINDGQSPLALADATVGMVKAYDYNLTDSVILTKFGVALTTAPGDVKKAFQTLGGYETDGGEISVCYEPEDGDGYAEVRYEKKGNIVSLMIDGCDYIEYDTMHTDAQRAESMEQARQRMMEAARAAADEYAGRYAQLVERIEEEEEGTAGEFYIAGTVEAEVPAEKVNLLFPSNQAQWEGTMYLVRDAAGDVYGVTPHYTCNTGDPFPLAVGDTVEVYGVLDVLYTDEADNRYPVIQSYLVQREGAEIYFASEWFA